MRDFSGRLPSRKKKKKKKKKKKYRPSLTASILWKRCKCCGPGRCPAGYEGALRTAQVAARPSEWSCSLSCDAGQGRRSWAGRCLARGAASERRNEAEGRSRRSCGTRRRRCWARRRSFWWSALYLNELRARIGAPRTAKGKALIVSPWGLRTGFAGARSDGQGGSTVESVRRAFGRAKYMVALSVCLIRFYYLSDP